MALSWARPGSSPSWNWAVNHLIVTGSGGTVSAQSRLEVGDDLVGGEAELLEDLTSGGVVEELLRYAVGVDRHVDPGRAQREGDRSADAAADEVVLHDGHGLGVPGELEEVVADGKHPARVDDAYVAAVRGDLLA